MAKHSRANLADVALAGLASKENFRKVNLRSVKSTDVVTNNSTLPYNKLMLIRIKGQRHKRRNCVFVFYKYVLNGGVKYGDLSPITIYNEEQNMLGMAKCGIS